MNRLLNGIVLDDGNMLSYGIGYKIPEYNGYELTITPYNVLKDYDYENLIYCQVRSTKNFRAHPNGYLIAHQETRSGKRYYELSDYNNIRRRLTLTDILNQFNKYSDRLLTVQSNTINIWSRQRALTRKDPPKKPKIDLDKTVSINFGGLINN